jgi:histidinol-phosphate aminotransferase
MLNLTPKKSVFMTNVNPSILALAPYVAGPTIEEIANASRVSADSIVKLSSNENPLGPSPKVVETIQREASRVSQYPTTTCIELRDAIANKLGHGLQTRNIVVGAGSSEIFSFIVRAFSKPREKVLFADPSFPVYKDASLVDGRVPLPIKLKEPRFDLDSSAFKKKLNQGVRIIFLTRPNNPTSRLIPLEEVRRICELAPRKIVVCDEAYIEFADDYSDRTAVNLLSKCANLLVTRTFSKAYGLSDLRVGYAAGPPEAIDILFKIRPKWNNGELAQKAAIAALQDDEHLHRTLKTIRDGRTYLNENLRKNGYLVAPDPQGNFLFCSPSPLGIPAEIVLAKLLRRGIAVRGPPTDWTIDYLRISVGTSAQNARLMSAIEDLSDLRS